MEKDTTFGVNLVQIEPELLVDVLYAAQRAITESSAPPKEQRAWLTALAKAFNWCLVSTDVITLTRTDMGADIRSDSVVLRWYHATSGRCECQAVVHGKVCWHRAAARLLHRYSDAVQARDHVSAHVKAAMYEKAKADLLECFV